MLLPPMVRPGLGGLERQQLLGRDSEAEEEVGKERPVSREGSHPRPLRGPALAVSVNHRQGPWVPSHPSGSQGASSGPKPAPLLSVTTCSAKTSKAEWAQQLPLGKGTVGYWQELWFATQCRDNSAISVEVGLAIRLWQLATCCEYQAVLQLPSVTLMPVYMVVGMSVRR